MAGIVICEMDLTKLMVAKYKPTVITELGPTKVRLTLEDKDIIKVVDDDPLLQQKMVDAGQHVFRTAGEKMAGLLQEHDKLADRAMRESGPQKLGQIADLFRKKLEIEGNNAGKDADKAAAKVWADLVKTRKEYSKYKWKTAFSIFLGIFGVGASIAGAVVTSATGVGAVIAAYGAYTSAATAIGKMSDGLKSSSQVYLRLRTDLGKLVIEYTEFDKKSSAAAQKTAKEVLAAASEKFLAIEKRSLGKCTSDLGLFRSKLKGVEVDAHSAAADLNKALKEWDKAVLEIRKGSPALRERAQKLPDMAPAINDSILKIASLMQDVQLGAVNSAKLEETITVLKQGVNQNVVKAARTIFGGATGALLIFGMGVPNMAKVVVEVKTGLTSFRKAKEMYEELSK
jgi:hypothetical protein